MVFLNPDLDLDEHLSKPQDSQRECIWHDEQEAKKAEAHPEKDGVTASREKACGDQRWLLVIVNSDPP